MLKSILTRSFSYHGLIHYNRFSIEPDRINFSRVNLADVRFFKNILGKNCVKTEGIDGYNEDFMRWFKGNSPCVLFPSSTQQVSEILRHCYQRNIAVVPQSGNTGLVGGSVPVHDEIILSLRKLNKKYNFDAASGILECDAGFVLEEIDNRLATQNYMVPVDLGAKGSCLIGGVVSTNAGGIRFIRYGSMHANVTGLEVVIPNQEGTILKLGSNLRKDNSELHLHKLFIGSEGQLGVITSVSIQVVPKPISIHSALIGVDSFQKCLEVLKMGKQMLNEILSSFELIDYDAMKMVNENAGINNPLDNESKFYLLVETSGSNKDHDLIKMENFLSHCFDDELTKSGVLAKSSAEANHMWKIRENCSLALQQEGYVYKHDFSLPLQNFYELTEVVKERLNGKAKRIVTFGHIGDGNAHFNVTAPTFSQEIYELLYPFVYEWVVSKSGSISAEHGIGRVKRAYHHSLIEPRRREFSMEIKKLFDPRKILSPYKMID